MYALLKFRVACRFLAVLWYALNSVLRERIAQIAVQNITIIFLCLATSTNATTTATTMLSVYVAERNETDKRVSLIS